MKQQIIVREGVCVCTCVPCLIEDAQTRQDQTARAPRYTGPVALEQAPICDQHCPRTHPAQPKRFTASHGADGLPSPLGSCFLACVPLPLPSRPKPSPPARQLRQPMPTRDRFRVCPLALTGPRLLQMSSSHVMLLLRCAAPSSETKRARGSAPGGRRAPLCHVQLKGGRLAASGHFRQCSFGGASREWPRGGVSRGPAGAGPHKMC